MPHRELEEQRKYMQKWRRANPDLVQQYRRKQVLESAIKKKRLPTPRSIQLYKFTQEELGTVLASITDHYQIPARRRAR